MHMANRPIKPRREGAAFRPSWESIEERAPSVLREEGPTMPRYVAVAGLMLITLGAAALVFRALNRPYLIPSGWGIFIAALGVLAVAYHAFNEKDFQFRRLYAALGWMLFAAAIFFRVFPLDKTPGDGFLRYGTICQAVALLFLLTFLRNESDSNIRGYTLNLLGFAALANALAGLIGGMISETFLLDTGVIHLIFGLLFACAYISCQGGDTPQGFWAGRGVGIIGALLVLLALGYSILPWVLFRYNITGRPPRAFFLPSGLILLYLGVEYLIVYLGVCSDSKLVVLTRRELASFFCSPVVYVLMIGMSIMGWYLYLLFVADIVSAPPQMGSQMMEPIVRNILVSFMALIPLIILVPVITMRLLSDEKRTGTLEVLLTAPVDEWQVVLAKFFAGLRVFMLCWYLWGVFFVALRIEGGQEFDYRPIITFYVALLCMGAGFIGMGLFFSSVTRHQIMAAILTFVIMLVLLVLFFVGREVREIAWLSTVITYVSYVDLWISSASGTITPRFLVFNLSMAIIWVFVSIKVLEARKWS
jgi:ABC-type transport system involved in multi-copper enzyme maturation permease subunit